MAPAVVSRFLPDILESTQIPALPSSAVAILQLAQTDDAGPSEFAKPIEADVGLLGQVLRFVNSSYFGFAREITNVRQAIALVGVRPIQNFVLWSAVFSLVPNPKVGSFDLKALWQDSLRRGFYAKHLGMKIGLNNAEELFVASLLQDIAIPILLKSLPEEYTALIEKRAASGRRLSELEVAEFGWNHAEAAALLCRNWKMPDSFAALVEMHPHVHDLLNAENPRLDAAVVAIAAMLPSCSDAVWCEQNEFFDALEMIRGDRAIDFYTLFQTVDEQTESFAPLLKLPPPKIKLTSWLAAAARHL